MLSVHEWTGKDATELCKSLRMTESRFAAALDLSIRTVAHWRSHPDTVPRPSVQAALDKLAQTVPGMMSSAATSAALLGQVPQGFPASSLVGLWVTAYQFSHHGAPQHHADIARITAEVDGRLLAVNHPPEPRTEGRATPFHNAIEGRLINRHFIGHWKNTSDTRYFGAVHLAVLPGEMTLEGYYTGFATDVLVSMAPWKWVRLQASDADLKTVMLRDPALVYDAVMNHQYDMPIALADVREEV